MSHFSPGLISPALASISLADTATSALDQTTYTFTVSFGSVAPGRLIVVGVGTRFNGQSVSALTIGGISATRVKSQESTFNSAELWAAYVPTGTSGNVVVTWSAATTKCAISVYRLLNLQSSTPTDTAGSTTDPLSVIIGVKDGGVVVAFSFGGVNGTNTWTGLTEDADATADSQCYSSASKEFIAAQSSLSITCDGSIAYQDPAMAVAAFR